MRYNYTLLWLLSLFALSFMNAQCPENLGSLSSTELIHFKIDLGTCETYPVTITAEGSTFKKILCSGTNLKYELISGSPLVYYDTFSANLGFGTCDYAAGVLRRETLSIEQVSIVLNSLKVFPNPLMNENNLNLNFSTNIDAQINIYDLTGKIVLTDSIINDSTKLVNVFSLTNGIYMLQIKTEDATTTRKIVIRK